MTSWFLDYPVTLVLIISFFALLCYTLWLRYRMAVSKARFALAAVSTLASCLFAFLAFTSGPLPIQIAHTIASSLGFEKVATSTEGPHWFALSVAAVAAVVTLALIYRFSIQAIRSWDLPPTVGVNELAKQEQDNNLALLALTEARRLARFKSDPIANEAATNWQHRQSEAPSSPPWHQLAKSLFEAAFAETLISDTGWRDLSQVWVGRMYTESADTAPLLLFVFDDEPTDEALVNRIVSLRDGTLSPEAKLFAVFNNGPTGDVQVKLVNGHNIQLWPRRTLLRAGLKLTDYARDLIRRFDIDALGGTEATLKKTFVESHVIKHGTENRTLLQGVVSEWLSDSSRRHLAITGEYGQGKSTAMLALCVEWARRYLQGHADTERVPLLIELRGKNPAESDPLTFLSGWTSRYGLSPKQVYNLVKSGDAIVIFEGFDELRNAGRAYDRHEHFNALWRMAFPGTKVVFTGRPNFFLDEREKNRTLRTDSLAGATGNAFTELWELDRLTIGEVAIVAHGFGAVLGESIVAAATANPAFMEIVSRPSMLPVVATIWGTIEELQNQGYSITSAVLLENYLQAAYRRKEEEIERDQRDLLAPMGASYLLLPREMKEVFTLAVIWKMAGSDSRNTITRLTFNNVISQIFDDVFAIFQKDGVPAHLTHRVREFEERFKDEKRSDKLERVSNEIASAGLFVTDPAGGPSNLRLPHKQFYEYLIAKASWIILKHPQTDTAKVVQSVDRRDAFGKLLAEDLPPLFFSEMMEDDFSIFRDFAVITNLFIAHRIFETWRGVIIIRRRLLGYTATESRSSGKSESNANPQKWRVQARETLVFTACLLMPLLTAFIYVLLQFIDYKLYLLELPDLLRIPVSILIGFAPAIATLYFFTRVRGRMPVLMEIVRLRMKLTAEPTLETIRIMLKESLVVLSKPNRSVNKSYGKRSGSQPLRREFRDIIAPIT